MLLTVYNSYIYGENSRARLKITQSMLTQILTYHQVMPAYLDFISVFGSQSKLHDLRFSSFREQATLADPLRSRVVHGLGRSGRQYQLCYNLKCVALGSEDITKFMLSEWSMTGSYPPPIRYCRGKDALDNHQMDPRPPEAL